MTNKIERKKERDSYKDSYKEKLRVLEANYGSSPYGFVSEIVSEPDDFQQKAVKKVFETFKEAIKYVKITEDMLSEFASDAVDIWNDDLSNWLKFPNSGYFVNSALAEEIAEDKENIFSYLMAGQYLEYMELFQGIYSLLEK